MLSRFYNGDSAIHGLSPMSKIIGLFIVLILVLFNHDLFSSLFLAIFVCGLVLMSKIPVKLYLRGVLSYGPFLILLFLILFLFFGFVFAFSTVINFALFLICVMMVVLTCSDAELIYGSRQIIGSDKYSLSVLMVLKFVPILSDNFYKALNTLKVRGVDFKFLNFIWKLKVLLYSILPIIRVSIIDINELYRKFKINYYAKHFEKTNFRTNEWDNDDNWFLIGHLEILIMMILKGVIL